MKIPKIWDTGEYKIPNAIKPIWKLGSETPNANDNTGVLINNDNTNKANPVSIIDNVKL